MSKEKLETIITNLIEHLQTSAEITIESIDADKYQSVKLEGDDLSFLIGYHGKTLEALQHLVNLMMYNDSETSPHITVDINGYKDRRAEKLHEIAKKYIDKARFFDKEVHLPPMTAWERRQVHMWVSEYDDVATESMGEKEERHIVLKKKK
jgi:spoIIIJ-associated protein